jgi:hypothetical protein
MSKKPKTYDPEVIKSLMVVIEMTRAEVGDAAQQMILDELSGYPKDLALKALHKCLKELRPGQFYIGAVLDRIDLGHPSPELAWAMASKAADEGEAVLWTDMMAQAWGQVYPLVAEGDKIAARMAFKECYGAALEDAQLHRRMPVWELSPGTDRKRTNEVLAMAVRQGHISLECAEVLALPTPSSDMAAIQRRSDEEQAKLLTHSPRQSEDGEPVTIGSVLEGLKASQAARERERTAAHQAAIDRFDKLKKDIAARVNGYAKSKGITL